MKDSWDSRICGNASYILAKKLKMLKSPLLSLNKKDFFHISSRLDRAIAGLENLQSSSSQFQPQNGNLPCKSKKSLCAHSCTLKKIYFSQLSKSSYILVIGILSFSTILCRNKAKNFVASIEKPDRERTDSGDVGTQFVNYYQNLLGTCQLLLISHADIDLGPKLSAASAVELIKEF